MARLTKSEVLAPTLDAAETWISRSLIRDSSLFSDAQIWRSEFVAELVQCFVKNLDPGEGSFMEKLLKQVSGVSPSAQKLMAEMMWALLLFPTNIDAETKIGQVQSLWKVSGEALPSSPLLSPDVLRGIGSCGTGYNMYRWKELSYLILVVENLKRQAVPDRSKVLRDYDAFTRWIQSVPEDGQRQFRQVLRYFAFPDTVERMSTNTDRRAILAKFEVASVSEINKWDERELDSRLATLRKNLEGDFPGEVIDFYEHPLIGKWRPADKGEISIRKIMRLYAQEKIVFPGVDRGSRYFIQDVNESGVEIVRIDSCESEQVTFDQLSKLVKRVISDGETALEQLSGSPAVCTAVLQASELGLATNRKTALSLTSPEHREAAFMESIGSLNVQNSAYKPAMLLCVVDGIDDGTFASNEFTFDALAPRFVERMEQYGEPVSEEQAAQPFYHLSGDFIWMHSVHDTSNVMTDGRQGSSAARNKVKYARLKDTYWELLQLESVRPRVRARLLERLKPNAEMKLPEISTLVPAATADLAAGGLQVDSPQLHRMVASLMAKPFLILTGLAGSGKTKLAQAFARWLSSQGASRDPFFVGAQIPSDQKTYEVTASDSVAVEFKNSDGNRVMLPREMIREWADYIRDHRVQRSTGARVIREQVKAQSVTSFSSQLHSFETHLKASAFALVDAEEVSVSRQGYAVVAVGADWTGNENILGYPDGLDPDRYVMRSVLEVILQARANPNRPHFVILDEMNLSHVERYFADFLSAIESGEKIRLHHDFRRSAGGLDVPPEICLPKNLFVIGTVNVDETTYMFSPKVLDRANVIEFRMVETQLGKFLQTPRPIHAESFDGRGDRAGFGQAMLLARDGTGFKLPEHLTAKFEAEMVLFFRILQAHGAEFGFRVANEAARYICFYGQLGGYAGEDTNWFEAAFDAIIVQKFLPKLHGSRPRIEGLLWALAWACGSPRPSQDSAALLANCMEAGRAQDEARYGIETVVRSLDGKEAHYPLSFNKVRRMWDRVVREQFVSFAEA